MNEDSLKVSGWGGAREGAGRKKICSEFFLVPHKRLLIFLPT